MPGGLPKRTVARAARHRGRHDRADHPRSAKVDRGFGRGVLFPGLRLGAAVLPGRARHPGDAVRRRRADACCRPAICAAAIRRPRRASTTRARRSSPTTACCSTASPTRSTISTSRPSSCRCGTCMDQLQKYEFDKIFPGCRLLDIHEYLLEKGVKLEGVDRRALHVPRPLPHADEDLPAAQGRQRADGRRTVPLNDRCCGESGTLAVDASRHLDAGALPQGRGNAQGRRQAARRRLRPARSRC